MHNQKHQSHSLAGTMTIAACAVALVAGYWLRLRVMGHRHYIGVDVYAVPPLLLVVLYASFMAYHRRFMVAIVGAVALVVGCTLIQIGLAFAGLDFNVLPGYIASSGVTVGASWCCVKRNAIAAIAGLVWGAVLFGAVLLVAYEVKVAYPPNHRYFEPYLFAFLLAFGPIMGLGMSVPFSWACTQDGSTK